MFHKSDKTGNNKYCARPMVLRPDARQPLTSSDPRCPALPTLSVRAALWVLLAWLCLLPAHAETLDIASNDKYSPIAEICERVVQEAARRAGVTLRIQRRPLTRGSIEANDGELDGEVARIAEVTRQFPNLIKVPVAVAWNHAAVYGRPADIAGKSRDELRKLRIGTTRGTAMLKKYTEGLEVYEAADIDAVLAMLGARQVDIAVLLQPSTVSVLTKQGSREFVAWPAYWASEPLFFILNKKHAALAERFEAALAEMEKEGLIDKIFAASMKQLGVPALKPATP